MKVRIGFGLGVQGLRRDGTLPELVDGLEANGFDSLWLSERLTGDAPDPVVGLAFAAGRTSKLKLGTSVQVLPGRNPALLAKEWASLDRLSNGRALPAFGLGVANPAEQQAFGVERSERAAWFDEALPLIRRMWTEDDVDHDGPRFSYRALSVRPKPIQQPPDVWLGGRAKSELRRVGRLGDGWLPSFSTPAEVAAGRVVVEEAAAQDGREIEVEHFGALVIYTRDEIPELLRAGINARRPDIDPAELVPVGLPAVRATLEGFLEHGFSKLVLVPAHEPASWTSSATWPPRCSTCRTDCSQPATRLRAGARYRVASSGRRSVQPVMQDRDDDAHDEDDAAEEAEVAEELVQGRLASERRAPVRVEQEHADDPDEPAHQREHEPVDEPGDHAHVPLVGEQAQARPQVAPFE
jgi:probable F420-dependent oxidoreductase